jgi:hypothetical protein
MIDQADDMKAIGHDPGIRKVLPHQRPVDARQIHADHLHQMFALEAIQIAFQRGLAATENHIMDPVAAEIAKRGGVAVAAGKEMLIDAQNLRARAVDSFIQGKLEELQNQRSTVEPEIPSLFASRLRLMPS